MPTSTTRLSRTRDEHGMIGITALAIILLLTAFSLAIFINAQSSVQATRDSREYLQARHNLDTALAAANQAISDGGTVGTGAGTGPGHTTHRPSTWSWDKTYHADPATDTAGIYPDGDGRPGGTVAAEGVRHDNVQDHQREWRQRSVGSVLTHNPWPTYGVAAPSAWLSTLASEDNSTLGPGSQVTGDWHAYGSGMITIDPGSTVDRVITYDRDADATRSQTTVHRSTIAAILDERLLNDRVRGCGSTGINHWRTSDKGSFTTSHTCVYDLTVNSNITLNTPGVFTVVAYGNVDIRANITVGYATELHLYTPSGSVSVRGNAAPTLGSPQTAGGGFYLFAPNALCKTYNGLSVNVHGSMACRQIQARGQFTPTTSLPTVEAVDTALPKVSYLEAPGYTDRFTPTTP